MAVAAVVVVVPDIPPPAVVVRVGEVGLMKEMLAVRGVSYFVCVLAGVVIRLELLIKCAAEDSDGDTGGEFEYTPLFQFNVCILVVPPVELLLLFIAG